MTPAYRIRWACVAVIGLIAFGVAANPPQVRRTAPVPKVEEKDGKIYLWFEDGFHVVTPDGTKQDAPPPVENVGDFLWYDSTVSPDGKRLLWKARLPFDVKKDKSPHYKLVTRLLDEKKDETEIAPDIDPHVMCWGPDGNTLYIRGAKRVEEGEEKPLPSNWNYDFKAKKLAPLSLPDKHWLELLTPDGAVALTKRQDNTKETFHQQYHLVTLADGKASKFMGENQFLFNPRLSPAGDRLLTGMFEFAEIVPAKYGGFNLQKEKTRKHLVVDLATGKQTELKVIPSGAQLHNWAWSLGGRRIAVVWSKPLSEKEQAALPKRPWPNGFAPQEFTLAVMNADGTGLKEVYKTTERRLCGLDWR